MQLNLYDLNSCTAGTLTINAIQKIIFDLVNINSPWICGH